MKIRNGFVSNSSSASFIIGKFFMSGKDIEDFRLFCKDVNNHDTSYISEYENYFNGRVDRIIVSYIDDFMNEHNITSEKYVLEEE